MEEERERVCWSVGLLALPICEDLRRFLPTTPTTLRKISCLNSRSSLIRVFAENSVVPLNQSITAPFGYFDTIAETTGKPPLLNAV